MRASKLLDAERRDEEIDEERKRGKEEKTGRDESRIRKENGARQNRNEERTRRNGEMKNQMQSYVESQVEEIKDHANS
ncbi:hypothetical protein AVEN_41492-1 [Araneus ventricosus]|uniref:Uncharacterized protein n=1 Tax=Araneus ventricosus TaxID=182803 RepID=A0A4Y2SQ98_ARAVE|nr:hypothetical protein AVEN_41492-1 [Araneus ventricosus]